VDSSESPGQKVTRGWTVGHGHEPDQGDGRGDHAVAHITMHFLN
jgi:hypothetical protein